MARLIAALAALTLIASGCGENSEIAGVDRSSAGVPSTTIETSPDQTPTTDSAALESTASSASTDELETLTLTAAQLDELWPSVELVGSLMGAAGVEEVANSYGPPVDLPPTATSVGLDYWSLDTVKRSIGVEPVDLISVQLVLLENDADVLQVFEAVIAFDAVYWEWIPIEVPGAAEALKSEWISYEGEPDDEPEFGSTLARRDLLVVVVTAAGSDAEAVSRTATAIAVAVFDRVGEISKHDPGQEGVVSDDPVIWMAEISDLRASAEPGRIVGFIALDESASSGPPSSPTQPVCVGAGDFITITPGAAVAALTPAGDEVATSTLRGSAYDGHVGCGMWFSLDLPSSDRGFQLDIAGHQLSDAVDPVDLDASGWVLQIWATPGALAANCTQAEPTTCALLVP